MNQAVEKIAKEKMVEDIITNIVKDKENEDYKDLANDIYLELLEKDQECLNLISQRGQMGYYLTRIVLNNINSKTSRFYYKYGKWNIRKTSIENATETGQREKYDKD